MPPARSSRSCSTHRTSTRTPRSRPPTRSSSSNTISSALSSSCSSVSRTSSRPPSRRTCARCSRSDLELHDLFLFGLRDVLDLSDVFVGQILDRLLALLALVLGDLLPLLRLLHHLHRVAPRGPHGHARLLGLLVDALREVPAALLRQRRDRQAHELAIGDRVDPQIARADRLVDHREHDL